MRSLATTPRLAATWPTIPTFTSLLRFGTPPKGPSRLRSHNVGRVLEHAPLLRDCTHRVIRNHCRFSVATSGRATSQVRVSADTALFLTRHDDVMQKSCLREATHEPNGRASAPLGARALGIAFALFISVFALDVFGENFPLSKLLVAIGPFTLFLPA